MHSLECLLVNDGNTLISFRVSNKATSCFAKNKDEFIIQGRQVQP